MQESLSQWRTKIGSTGKEWEERQRALQAEKDIMAKHYSALKAAMEQFRAQQNVRLKHLSTHRCLCMRFPFCTVSLCGRQLMKPRHGAF